MKQEDAIKLARFILSALREAAKDNTSLLKQLDHAEKNISYNLGLAYDAGFNAAGIVINYEKLK